MTVDICIFDLVSVRSLEPASLCMSRKRSALTVTAFCITLRVGCHWSHRVVKQARCMVYNFVLDNVSTSQIPPQTSLSPDSLTSDKGSEDENIPHA